ncbi:MAG: hypothetical protein HUU46_11695 [Candidatus Hydrogenedentes bacterium]|nr:hypothetical protein [Candidatus Hydrogenedentota bacterium]
MRVSGRARLLGVAALAGYAVHAMYHVSRGEPEHAIWVCHLAAAFVGVGLLAGTQLLLSVGALHLALGTPLWLFDLSQGGEFLPTSLGTHVLGLAIGLWSIWRFGIYRGAWWIAAAIMLALIVLSRLITPARSNVNLAFATPNGMDRYISSHLAYLAIMIGISCVYFWSVETLVRRFAAAANPEEIAS